WYSVKTEGLRLSTPCGPLPEKGARSSSYFHSEMGVTSHAENFSRSCQLQLGTLRKVQGGRVRYSLAFHPHRYRRIQESLAPETGPAFQQAANCKINSV